MASLSAARPMVFCTRRIASLEPMSVLVSPDRRRWLSAAPGRQALEQSVELLATDRLGQMVERAEPHRLDGVLGGRKRRQDDDRQTNILRADTAQHLQAVHSARHPQIEQHAIEVAAASAASASRPEATEREA